MTRWTWALAAMTLMALLLAGCAQAPTPAPTFIPPTPTRGVVLGPEPPPTESAVVATPAEAKPAVAAKPVPPKAGNAAFPFTLTDLDGNAVTLESMQGKYLMLNFWASWCGPCRAEIPHMVTLRDELVDEGFEILAVNIREDKAKVEAFVEEMDMRFPVVLDTQGSISAAYFVRGIPTSVFIDPDGVIAFVHTGTLTEAQLGQYVERLMQ